ncbi:MAG: hypothetical protein AB7F75_00505 [Planctomycetota bacterium]
MTAVADELCLSFNTNLSPRDLVSAVFEDVFEGWFHPACLATDGGDILSGSVADDTMMDGRGILPLDGEEQKGTQSFLLPKLSLLEAQASLLDHLALHKGGFLEVSCIGSVGSGFRTLVQGQWRPRLSPGFFFTKDHTVFTVSLFNSAWLHDNTDIGVLAERLASLARSLGDSLLGAVDFESSGTFQREEDAWRTCFAGLPLSGKEFR